VKEPKVLEFGKKHDTQYAIPLWLRDEQILSACRRPIRRLEAYEGPTRDDPIAVVGFGPSLVETWEQIRDFKYIITCSGSHRFLLERGIVPNWHVEVDPRPHKVALLGPPHADVEYLVASTCHPEYFDHLGGFNVVLWHIFADEPDTYRVLPRGEWAVLGGSNVGLRAMTLARFYGFKVQHVFGMDGCQRDDTHKHAAPHPLQDGSGYSLTEYEGVTYKTTPAMLESAKMTFHELDQMPDVEATFHGEGLVQAMARKYARSVPSGTKRVIAVTRPVLISKEYKDLNSAMHQSNLAYGVGGGKHADAVLALAKIVPGATILDYGCGKGYLGRALPFPIWEYDPAVIGKDELPRPADIVACIDVLEHIEPERILFVLDDLKRVTRQIGYFVINTKPAHKTLPDGRNTHLIQEGRDWWTKTIAKFFDVGRTWERHSSLIMVVGAKTRGNSLNLGSVIKSEVA